ncbi:MAG: diguanylate cyclase [Clostridiales bacterium]|nr:diguanylate cyclase [Clostridiales bacterium]
MRSIKTKIMLMTVCAILIAVIITAVSGVFVIRNVANSSANQLLSLLCESGEKNLNHYFESVEQSVEMVSAYVESDLDGLDDVRLQAHIDRVSGIFEKLTYKTYGVLTYYYRIDPAVSTNAKGFWYVNLDGEGFKEHEVTDITLYDTEDTGSLVWFTVPKFTGNPIWLPPYITDNLDVRVISYNVPVYFEGSFVGVIGIEIDYSTIKEQVDSISLYDSGYAFINDEEGNIIYHPHIDVTTMETQPKVPEGLIGNEKFVHYNYEGVDKRAACLPLSNGMRINVTVPVSEINATWLKWSIEIVIVSAVLLAIFIILIMHFTGQITKPLRNLTEVAEQVDAGEYECDLEYNGDDEVGILTRTFKKLISHLKIYISDLNDLAYADALTSLHNKGAFDINVKNIEAKLNGSGGTPEFAVCIFDCNDLKKVNDQNGHDKGDIYLKEAATVICEVFSHSPVFRIGGDEFAAILLDRDFVNSDELLRIFDETCAGKRKTSNVSWEQVDVARGMAVFDPDEDTSVSDVVRRADKLMYENKWMIKQKLAEAEKNNNDQEQ